MKQQHLQYIPIEYLSRGKFQPRVVFSKDSLQELATSISSNGLLQPIVVKKHDTNKYEIIAGERRWRASQQIGLDKVPCIVNEFNDEQTAAASLAENINRENLNPIEEAQAYHRLISTFKYSHEEVAAITGKSRAKITNSLRLLNLHPSVIQMIINKEISEGHGKTIAGITIEKQYQIAQHCKHQQLSVRQLEKYIKKVEFTPKNHTSANTPDLTSLEEQLTQQQ